MVKTVKDVELKGKRVIMRVDFNVPMKDGKVQDGERIVASIPTIKYLLEHEVKSIVLMSHLGDPEKDVKKAEEKAIKEGKAFDRKDYIKAKHHLLPVANYLSSILGKEVKFAPSCLGQLDLVNSLSNGDILMLENTRLEKGEKAKDETERETFAKELAKYGDIFVNDAFGSAHREHSSTSTIAKFTNEAVAGLLMEKEITHLEPILKNPEKPFTAIIGGAKVSSKISVLQSLLSKASTMIIGGGMAYTFLKAMGHSIGSSILEEEYLDVATSLLNKAKELNVKIILPVDHICAEKFSENATPIYIENMDIPDNMLGMDVGKKTLSEYKEAILCSKTIMWNGPVGVFEFEAFATGTEYIAKMIAEATEKGAISVVGGGDSVAALNKFNLASKMTHVSTGGGASLEYLEGKILPGIACLQTR
ncbi:MAG: phosphoglycerate kinase [Treponema sp.]